MLSLLVLVNCLALQSQVHERVELHLPHAAPYDWMGESVAMEGTRVLVGVPFDDSPEGNDSGSARVFERGPDGTWAQVANLRAGDRAPHEDFGGSVSLSGERALVGAPQAESYQGAAYVFERGAGNVWSQTAKLVASTPGQHQMGHGVALSGGRALVGAHESDEAGEGSGSAYLFERNPDGSWSEVVKLTASDAAPLDKFGIAVALEGDRALVGAWGNDFTGAAYVFERDASGSWLESARLESGETPSGTSLFGGSVALSGARALVGERTEGAAYVFEPDAGGMWAQVVKLEGSSNAFFGYDVSLSGDRAVVGAYWGPRAHLFERDASGAWVERLGLVHEPQGTDWFGFSVAISGDWIAVGAPRDSDLWANSGSTTVFKLPSPGARPDSSTPGLYSPPIIVPLLLQSWRPFDPAQRPPGLPSGWVPIFRLP